MGSSGPQLTPGVASGKDVNSIANCSLAGDWPAQPGFHSAWTATQDSASAPVMGDRAVGSKYALGLLSSVDS
jgi:hypothetical protein